MLHQCCITCCITHSQDSRYHGVVLETVQTVESAACDTTASEAEATTAAAA